MVWLLTLRRAEIFDRVVSNPQNESGRRSGLTSSRGYLFAENCWFTYAIPGADERDSMRAVRYHEAGGPSVLELETVDRPTVSEDEVLVEIRAASVNPTDAKRRARGAGPLPKTTGSDFAGMVSETGANVDEFDSGDRVCGTGLHTTRFHQGSFAEYVAVPTDVITHLPESVSFEDGAAVALVGVTAWMGLVDVGGLEPTENCLVHGGTGGVGHVAVQLSNAVESNTVATTSPERQQVAVEFGADVVVPYSHDNLIGALGDAAPRGFDVIFDHRAHEYFASDLEVAAFEGRLVLYGGVDGTVDLAKRALFENLSIHAMTMSNLATRSELPSIAGRLRRVLELVERGIVSPSIARTYRFDEASEAHRAVLEDSFVGKLVVVP